MLNEFTAIQQVNKIIQQSTSDSDYVVRGVRSASWGWLMEWMPQDPSKIIYGESAYLVHKNGYIKQCNDIVFRYKLHPTDMTSICKAFVAEAEEKARIRQSVH